MSSLELDQFEKLCCDYGHKSPNVFEIEFRRMAELKSKLEPKIKFHDDCDNSLNSTLGVIKTQEQEIKQLTAEVQALKYERVDLLNRCKTLSNNGAVQ